MQTYSDALISAYNKAVSQYQRACKKKRIKPKDQKYRPISDKNSTALVLHSVEGDKELSTAITTLQAVKEKLSDQCSAVELELFLQRLSVTLYRNEYPPITYTVIDKNTVELLLIRYGKVTVTFVDSENIESRHINIDFELEKYSIIFAKYGLSEIRPIAPTRNLTTIIMLIQDETINLLLD